MQDLPDFLVFDLETQRDIRSVGGRSFIDKLKMSIGVVYDSRSDQFTTYHEDQAFELFEHLMSGPIIIGFNHVLFDFEVLSYYNKSSKEDFLGKLKSRPNLDIMLDIKKTIGHFVSLESLAKPTLHAKKSADGLQALDWYSEFIKSGDSKYLDLIAHYCKDDVDITKNIFLYGFEFKKIFHETKNGEIKAINIDWQHKKFQPIEPAPKIEKQQASLF